MTELYYPLFSALLAFFLSFCIADGGVFKFWLPFITRQHIKRTYPEICAEYDRVGWAEMAASISQESEDPNYNLVKWSKDLSKGWFWFKPLGGCVVCSHVWQYLALLPIKYYLWGTFYLKSMSLQGFAGELFFILFFLLLSNTLVRVLDTYVD